MVVVTMLFFLSGFAALVYQLLWFRHLGLIFGNTVYAATTVITAFMLGLAVGAFVAGRRAHRLRKPLHIFALLEALIALYALILPLLFLMLSAMYKWGYQNVSDSLLFLTPLRFILAIVILAVPTILMGATLPVLAQGMLHSKEHFGRRLGWLYGINTLGAVSGVLISAFLLIPTFGLRMTNWMAISIDLAVAVGALAVAKKWIVSTPESFAIESGPAVTSPHAARAWCILIAVAASGFLSLGFEVVWFRTLILIFGSTTYSFSVMLAVFLLGIALGSVILSYLADRMKVAMLVFAGTEIGVAVFSVWSFYQFDGQPYKLLQFLVNHDLTWHTMISAKFHIAFFFLFVPALLFGVDIPIAARAFRDFAHNAPRTIGDVYMFNTLGAVLGSVIAGFFLVPYFGMLNSLILLACLTAMLGIFITAFSLGFHVLRIIMIIIAISTITIVITFPPTWSKDLMAAGAYFSPWKYINNGEITLNETLEQQELIYFNEGITATVAVMREDDGDLTYISDGKVEADTSELGMIIQRMMGHLPMLFHSNPKDVLNIGLGAGVTFGSLGCYPVDTLHVVELEPGAIGGATAWSDYNHNIMHDPQAKVIINDGRNHLFSTTNRYDVITSDTFEPVVAGAANLFTLEYFELQKRCLKEGGIACQWIPMYELSEDDYSSILESFVHVFPESILFFTGTDTIFLGFKDEAKVDPSVVAEKFDIPEVRSSLEDIGFHNITDIFGMFIAKRTDWISGNRGLNVDNHPKVEFSAPKNALHQTSDVNQKVLLENATAIPSEIISGLTQEEFEQLERNREALLYCLRSNVLRIAGDNDGAFKLLMQAYQTAPGNSVIRNQLANIMMGSADQLRLQGALQEAVNQYQMVLRLRKNEFWALFRLVELAMRAGQVQVASPLVDRALQAYPDSGIMAAMNGKYLFSVGRFDEALEEMNRAIQLDPDKQAIRHDYQLITSEIAKRQAQSQ